MKKYDNSGINFFNNMIFKNKEAEVPYSKEQSVIIQLTSMELPRLVKKISINGFKVCRKSKKKLILDMDDRKIEFSKISDIIKLEDKEELKKLRKTLVDPSKRTGHCHSFSMRFYQMFDYLVTGYIDSHADSNKIIHSWLEKDNYVYDFSKNLMIDRNTYYEIYNVEVLNKISKENIDKDLESLLSKFDNLSLKMYCLFRDDIIKELDKNKLLEKTR